MDFPKHDSVQIAEIEHAKSGMTWQFGPERSTEWSWHEMVAQFDPASMKEAVQGPDGRSRGLVGCSFEIRPNSYDHKRSHMLKETTGHWPKFRLPVWDFVLHRDDGTGMRLHPQWSPPGQNNKSRPQVETYALQGHTNPVPVPEHGYGRSDGRGTYRWQKEMGCEKTLRFDTTGTKLPPGPQSRRGNV